MEADGYAVVHHGQNFTTYFGPFATRAEVLAWLEANPTVNPWIVPLWRTVDWDRKG